LEKKSHDSPHVPRKMQLSIEETWDLLLPYADHAEHAPLRQKTFDTFHALVCKVVVEVQK